MKFLILYLILLLNSIIARPNFDIGTSLWQFKNTYTNTLDIGIEGLNKNTTYSFYIPLFIRFDNYPYIFGIPNKTQNTFQILEQWNYTTLFIRNLTYTNQYISTGIKRITQLKNRITLDNMLFGNPGFDKNIPFEGSSVFIEHSIINLYTSSLQNPSLVFTYFNFNQLIKDLKIQERIKITPLLWIDYHLDRQAKQIDYGIAMDVQYILFNKNIHALSINMMNNFNNDQLLHYTYRNLIGFGYHINGIQIKLNSIIQSNNHIYGPTLSYLYPSRRNIETTINTGIIPAFSFMIGSDTLEHHHFFIHFETYFLENKRYIYSFRGEYVFTFNSINISTSLLKERIETFASFANYNNPDTFIGIDISANLINNLFKAGANTYFNWNDNLIARTKIYVKYIF